MKKVLVGILILIPVCVLLLVTLVSNVVSTLAHIGVESIEIEMLNGESSLTFNMNDISGKTINLYDYLNVNILPERATNQTVEWQLSDLKYLDEEYETSYKEYIADKTSHTEVKPAAMLVDDNNQSVETNTTGKLVINSYCSFKLKAMAENQSDVISVYIAGYDVEKIVLSNRTSEELNRITIGESKKIEANITPIDSIVSKTEWYSDNEAVAIVDNNGVISGVSIGTAKIYMRAYKYSNPEAFVESAPYTIEIVAGPSTIYGAKMSTHLNEMTLTQIGIPSYESYEGCTIDDVTGKVTLTAEIARIITSNGTFEIRKCSENGIAIRNAAVLDAASGFVLEVSDLTLKLDVVYVSSLRNEKPLVVWTSSNDAIASVVDGEVTGLSSGFVTIKAKCDSEEATIVLNVQKKIASMELLTSTSSYEVGLAKEYVFASERYVEGSREANSTLVKIKGEPEDATEEELKDFYEAYKFEIIEGKDLAYFDEDIINKIIFKPTLEGEGKASITVRVSAKYPKYVGFNYTTEDVTLKAVYGISVVNFDELRAAMDEQRTYAKKDGNAIVTTNNEFVSTKLDREVICSSKNLLSIVVDGRCEFPENEKVNDAGLEFYGNVYGNNNVISSKRTSYEWNNNTLTTVRWSDVTVSNVTFRANDIGDDGVISKGDETAELWGHCLNIQSEDCARYRIVGVRVEYSIFENCRCAGTVESVDATYDGCIFRNMSCMALYIVSKVECKDGPFDILFADVYLNNLIVSNCLGSAFDYDTAHFGIDDENNPRFAPTMEENDAYIKENIVAKGLNGKIVQTGFMDIYNWQSTDSCSLIQTNDKATDDLIASACGAILGTDPALENFRYKYQGVDYFHLGFMSESIDAGSGIWNETMYYTLSMEDTRIKEFKFADLQGDTLFTPFVKDMGMIVYGYDRNADIKPSSTYEINAKLIEKLHGNY